MSPRVGVWLNAGLILANATIVFFMVTLPIPDSYNLETPTIDALNGRRGAGCGLSTMDYTSHTVYFEDLNPSADLRERIRKEMLSKGFSEQRSDSATFYKKSTGGLFPDNSYVVIRDDGSVFVGASHSKWPQFR